MFLIKVKSPFRIYIFSFVLILAGLFSLPYLEINTKKIQNFSQIYIFFQWPQTSADIIEQQVTSKLEGTINTIKGIKKITSITRNNYGSIAIEIDKFADINNIRFELSALIRQIYKKLPKGVSYPTITLFNADENSNNEIFQSYSIFGNLENNQLREIAENVIKPSLFQLPDIHQINIYGNESYEWIIKINSDKIKNLDLQFDELISLILRANDKIPLGYIKMDENIIGNYFPVILKLNGESDYKFWNNLYLKSINGRTIYLKDIASIEYKEKQQKSIFRINGKNTINFNIYVKNNINILKLSKNIANIISQISAKLPEGVRIVNNLDNTIKIKDFLFKSLNSLIIVLISIFLAILILKRDYKFVIIIFISILCNVLFSIILIALFKMPINEVSVNGFIIAIILCSIGFFQTLVLLSKNTLLKHIISKTLLYHGLLFISFALVLFSPDNIKEHLLDISFIVCVFIITAVFINLFILPALQLSFKYKNKTITIKRIKLQIKSAIIFNPIINAVVRYKKWLIIILIFLFGIPSFLLPINLNCEGFLCKIYNSTIGSNFYNYKIRNTLDKYIGGGFRLFYKYVSESSYLQHNSENAIYISASLPDGYTIDDLDKIFQKIEGQIANYSQIKQFVSSISSQKYGTITVFFKDNAKKETIFFIKNQLIVFVHNYGGISWSIYGVGDAFSNDPSSMQQLNYVFEIKGYDLNSINQIADEIDIELNKNKRVNNLIISSNNFWWDDNTIKQFRLNIDYFQNINYNQSIYQILNEFKYKNLIYYPQMQIINNKIEDVNIVLDNTFSLDKWQILNYPSVSNLKLNQIVAIDKVLANQEIKRINQQYIKYIKYNYEGTPKFGTKFQNRIIDKFKTQLPTGFNLAAIPVSYTFDFNNSRIEFSYIILAILILYSLSAIFLESLIKPFISLLMLIISITGIFYAMYFWNYGKDVFMFFSFNIISSFFIYFSLVFINDFFDAYNKTSNNLSIIFVKIFLKNNQIFFYPIFIVILGFSPILFFNQAYLKSFAFVIIIGLCSYLMCFFIFLPIFLQLFANQKMKKIISKGDKGKL